MDIKYIIISLLLGLLPETLYFTLYIINIKEIKTKRILLYILISIDYLIFIMLQNYILINYFIFTFLFYVILKVLYKDKINVLDLFFIIYSEVYLTIISALCFFFVKKDLSNYFAMLIINKILLFLVFIFKKHIKKFYHKYCKFWNRNDLMKKPIKSITLRNISLILLNIFIFFVNIGIVSIINFLQGR